ncbi:iron chelate uptake ABC transporter family permease subunit [Mycetocola lacteus]|uniref:iron chelate uptake ABC transporter family permease subunit n=1 Tax=Mycetocola lacteus TaxID=76637 RepID=UPI001FE41F66|nr:iron chelate uptake ABC transporter family permease subunit [Mycetocola lacteus]
MASAPAPASTPTRTRQHTGRKISLLIAALALLVLIALGSLLIGSKAIPPHTVWAALFAPDGSPDQAIILGSRLPRAILGILAGAALGVAGALVQAFTRNPLAEPGLLGVNAGASLAIVLAVGTFGITAYSGYVWFAFAGALAAAALVSLIGMRGTRRLDPARLVLSGVALGAVLSGIGTGLALLNPSAFDQLRAWTVGSLADRGSDLLTPVAITVGIGLLLAALTGRGLNALALGEDAARGLGYHPGRSRVLILLAITVLAGSATAAVGAIGFLGLMAPHLARRISGTDQRWLLVFSAVLAPIILLIADVIGRVILPGELEAGVTCALIGAPVLVYLARRKKVAGL